MSKIRVGLVLLGDVLLCVVIVLLTQIDTLVNGTLYNYGLVFDMNWAQPYWLMLRISLILIAAAVFVISVVELPVPAFEDKAEKSKQEEQKLTFKVPKSAEIGDIEASEIVVGAETTETRTMWKPMLLKL